METWGNPFSYSRHPGFICRLLKRLYVLKQAPNIWNRTNHGKLLAMVFTRTDSDYGQNILKENDEVKLLLTVYVDNILLMGPRDLCAEISSSLQEPFEPTTMDTVKYLLGVENLIDRTRRQIIYCQRQFGLEVLKRSHIESCNGCATSEATTPSKVVVPCDKGLPTISRAR